MVLSDSEDLISRIKDLREYDNKDNYILRYNYKMTDIQAALGLSQLSFLEKFIERRREIAACYFQEFINCDFSLPVVEKEKDHIYYRFVIKTKDSASEYIEKFHQKNIRKPGIRQSRFLFTLLCERKRLKKLLLQSRKSFSNLKLP